MTTPAILHNPAAALHLKRGFDKLAHLLALTYGPSRGRVLSTSNLNGSPEILTDAATIARRVLALPHRAEDVGAMILRNLVWRMHRHVGDGGALTAILAQSLLDQAHRAVAAGSNPMTLRRGIDEAARVAVATLIQMARPVHEQDDLALVGWTMIGDVDLSRVLAEIFFRLGPDAHVTLDEYVAPYLACDFHEGGRWPGKLASPYFITDQSTQRAVFDGCYVALCPDEVFRVEDVQPALEMVAQTEPKRLALIAHEIRGAALSFLAANQQQGSLQVAGITLRRTASQSHADFIDLAALTGATVLSTEMGRGLSRIRPEDFGAALRLEASADEMVVVGGGAQPEVMARHLESLNGRIALLHDEDEEREELQRRRARLAGQAATLKLGAYTSAERTTLRQRAEQAVRALPLALREGIVPGGGAAFLPCADAVRAAQPTGEDGWGYAIVAAALEEPFLRLARNAGVAAPAALLAETRRRGPGHGFDVESGEIVALDEEGVLDPVGVLRRALETAVSGAVMALTTETIVLKRNPQVVYEP